MTNFATDSHSNNKIRRLKSKQEFFFFLKNTTFFTQRSNDLNEKVIAQCVHVTPPQRPGKHSAPTQYFTNAKHSLSLTRKTPCHYFSFFDISSTFLTIFHPKIFHMYSFKPFHAYYKIMPFSQVPISLIESQTSFLLKYKAFYVDGHTRPLNLNEF